MRQRNIVFKTIFITFGVALILAIAVFGIVSLAAPATMMRFTESLGLMQVSGDYAFQEYERSGSLDCLARSFIIAAERGKYSTAEERFELLYEDDGFEAFCIGQDEAVVAGEEWEEAGSYLPGTYRAFLCGLAARAKYRLAKTDEEKAEVIVFAVGETGQAFPAGNPSIALALEALKAEDVPFCTALEEALEEGEFEQNEDFLAISSLLKGEAQAA